MSTFQKIIPKKFGTYLKTSYLYPIIQLKHLKMNQYKKSGIYQILNLTNQKCYVGSSANINSRWGDHRSNLRNNKHGNKHLQNAWAKDLENNFIFRILEIVDNPTKERLEEREDYWIDYYDSMNEGRGYNKQKAQQGTFSEKWKNNCKKDLAIAKTVEYFFNIKKLNHVPEPTRRLIAENLFKYSSEGYTTKVDDYSKALKITLTKEDSKKEVLLQIEPYQVVSEEQFERLKENHIIKGKPVVELNLDYSIKKTFSQVREVLIEYPSLNRNQLENILYCGQNKKTIQNKIFLTEEKYNSLLQSNQLQDYFKRKVIPMKEGSRRHLQSLKSQEPKTKVLEVTDTITNSITEYNSIQDFLIQHQDQDFKRKGIEKVLYGELKTYKGKIFKYKKNE